MDGDDVHDEHNDGDNGSDHGNEDEYTDDVDILDTPRRSRHLTTREFDQM